MESRIKYLYDVEELQDFPDYGVDTEGNVWSFKCHKIKKLSPGWKKKKDDYKSVLLTNRWGRKRSFMVHRLVAMCFIPRDESALRIKHKNNNTNDNRLENLEWTSEYTKRERKFNAYVLDNYVSDKIKKVYMASIRKGLKVPNENEFFNQMIENALDSHIMQYGLRKVM